MKKVCPIFIIVVFFLAGCKKNDSTKFSGTVTIDNNLYGNGTYYAIGFSIISGKKESTLNSPFNLITIEADADYNNNNNIRKLYFDNYSFNNSFYRYGQYSDATTASLAFKNLTSFSDPPWTDTGDSVKVNQIWLYKTNADKYAKIRIINTLSEARQPRPFAQCTFEWVYQPDGTLTFP
jgi:hypothetical protein